MEIFVEFEFILDDKLICWLEPGAKDGEFYCAISNDKEELRQMEFKNEDELQ